MPARRPLDEVSALLSLAATSRDLLSRHDQDGSYLYVSPGFREVLGYDPSALIGSHPAELTHPDDLTATQASLARIAERGTSQTLLVRLRDADGGYRWFESTVNPVPASQGSVAAPGFQVVSRDVNERVLAQQREHRRSEHVDLLMRLALDVIDIPPERFDTTIDAALAAVGRATGFDRTCLLQYDEEQISVTTTHEWCADGIAPRSGQFEGVRLDEFAARALEHHRRGQTFVVADATAARGAWLLATAPLMRDGRCLGYVEFAAERTERSWSNEDEQILTVLAELTANAVQRRARETALHRSQSLLAMAGSVAGFGGWMWDLDRSETNWSDELRSLLDVPADQEPTFRELVEGCHPEDRSALEHAASEAIQHGTPWDIELRVPRTDGTLRWLRNVGTVERNEQGRVVRLWGAIQDVTSQRLATAHTQQIAERFARTMDSVTDGIVVLDASGRVSSLNRQAQRLFQRPREKLLGNRLDETIPEEVGGPFHQAELTARSEQRTQTVIGYYGSGGVWIEARFYPSPQELTIYLRDVTERIEREQRLEQIAATERATADRLRQLDAAKNAFLTAVSHELRTPLTVVQGMAETLQRLREHESTVRREELEDALVTHARRLTQLLDELLHVDRLSRGSLTTDPRIVDVAELVTRVCRSSDEAERISLNAPGHLSAPVDPLQCEQLISNLLANAEKYAPHGPIRVELTDLIDGGFRLAVRDQGPGIPADALEEVFDAFVRLDHDHPKPGTGVGLTLVREFAKLHGGHAWAENTDGQGACIMVEIPGGPIRSATNEPAASNP